MVFAMITTLDNLAPERDRVQALPEPLRAGSPSVVDHLLENHHRKILVMAGDFFCIIPVSQSLGWRVSSFIGN
jgi:hypothetical protein